jgi:N-acetylglucosaminyltransferase
MIDAVLQGLVLSTVGLTLANALAQRSQAGRFHRTAPAARSVPPDQLPSVDVVIPCFNEDPNLLQACCASLARQDYKGALRFWLVDDASPNRARLRPIYGHWGRQPRWQVDLHDHNLGKRQAQDTALRQATGELVLTIDSDTMIAPDGVRQLVDAFLADDRVAAVTGEVAAMNRSVNLLTSLIDQRYDFIFNEERAAQAVNDALLCCSGPFAMYRRSVLRQVWDDYLTQTYRGQRCVSGDDLHLTNLVLAADQTHKARYVPAAHAWTQVPETLGGFVRQQTRWNRSFYRELRWTRAALRGRAGYLYLDTAVRLLAPLLLAPLLVLAAADATAGLGDPGRDIAAVAAALTAGTLTTVGRRPGSARFTLLYGMLFICVLLPVRLWSLLTRARDHWGTRVHSSTKASLPRYALSACRGSSGAACNCTGRAYKLCCSAPQGSVRLLAGVLLWVTRLRTSAASR